MAEALTITKSKEGVQWSRPLDYVLGKLRNGQYDVTIQAHREPRSVSQNALLWMWIACISEATGQDKQDIYDAYCAMFLSRLVETRHGMVKVNTTSSHLTKAEMTGFLDRIQLDAAEMGIQLPNPEDAYFEAFAAEYQQRL